MAGGATSILASVAYAGLKTSSVKMVRDTRTNSVVGVVVDPIQAAAKDKKHRGDCACKACTMGMGGGRARLRADGPSSGGESPHYNVSGKKFDTKERNKLAKKGVAEPDGSYPIRNAKDLENAFLDFHRGKGGSPKDKAHIQKRAKALGLPDPFKKTEGKKMRADMSLPMPTVNPQPATQNVNSKRR